MSSGDTALPTLVALPVFLRYLPLLSGGAGLLSVAGWGWYRYRHQRNAVLWRCMIAERGLLGWGLALLLAGAALVARATPWRWLLGLLLGAFGAWCLATQCGRSVWSELPAVLFPLSGIDSSGRDAGYGQAPGWVFPLFWAVVALPLWFPATRPQTTILAIALAAVGLILVAVWKRAWPATPGAPALALLLLTAVISAWRSDAPALTLPKVTGLLLGVMGYWALWRWREAGGSTVAMALAYGALTLGFAIVGLAGGLRPTKVGPLGDLLTRVPRLLQSLPGTQHGRVSMNQLGGAIVHALPVLLALATCRPARRGEGEGLVWWAWLGSLLASLLLLGTLLLAQSRAAWVGMLTAGLVVLSGRSRWGLWALLGIAAGGLIAWVIWGYDRIALLVIQALVGPLPTPWGTVTLEGRLSIWETAAGYILRDPWLGQGLGTFRLEGVDDLAGRSVFDVGLPHAHNVFLGMAYDLGLPGLLAYLSLLLTWIMLGWRALDGVIGPERQVVLGALAGLVGSHAYGMMDAVALGAKPGVLFWMLGALIGVAALTGKRAARDRDGPVREAR